MAVQRPRFFSKLSDTGSYASESFRGLGRNTSKL